MSTADHPMSDTPRADPLLELGLGRGDRFAGGGNRPVRLSDPNAVWLVLQGSVDVFATRLTEGGVPTDFKHMLRAGPGRLVFPLMEEEGSSVLVAKGLPESELCRIPLADLAGAGLHAQTAEQVDAWVSELSESIVRDVTYRPHVDQSLGPGVAVEAAHGTTTAAHHGVVWASSPDGDLQYLGTEDLDQSGSDLVPITPTSWVVQSRAASVTGISTAELSRDGRLAGVVMEFNRLAMRADRTNRTLLLADVSNLQAASARHRRRSEEQARLDLFAVLGGDPLPTTEGPVLLRALKRIGRHENIGFQTPARPRRRESGNGDGEATLEEILDASGIRARRIALRDRDRWWLGDSGAMLASRRQDGAPVALIPGRLGRYRMFDSQSGSSMPVNSRRARTLGPTAHFFYRPFPYGHSSNAALLRAMAFGRAQRDLARLVGAGVLAGLAMLVPAVLLGWVVSRVLPTGDGRTLATVALALALVGVTLALLEMLKGTALMRLEGRAAARIAAGLWDRLLVLPPSFFRRFTVGDLGSRAMGFQRLRDQMAGVVAGSVLSLVFLLPTFALLLYYDAVLGGGALAMGAVSLGVTLWLGLRQLPHHRRLLAAMRRLTAVLLQQISGVAKLRVSGAEGSAYAVWAAGYREQKQTEMRLGALNEHLIAFTSAAPLLAVAGLLAVTTFRSEQGLPVGSFLATYAAFMVFYGAVAQFGFSFSAVAAILPAVEQADPILGERPRRALADAVALELQGELRIDQVTFRYAEDGPLILQDVSLHARPGEFIALVGDSGSGKSTLLRLALGLETPQSGAVYYDNHDLERLNRQTVRNGVGTVVQDASLRPQTVLDNIIGTGDDLTVEDAWRAARLASVDQDILDMPMGMSTVTAEGSSAFSGGQVQRIMLAAALVRSPSMLLLDEATNWLDNATQSKVMQEIERLSVTRIVSAHRLSTIRRADRIYVLQGGRVVQQGSFDDLMATDGAFRDMALRQMA